MKPTGTRCPRCGSPTLVPIFYGMPAPEAFEAAERGEIAIGGCDVGPGLPAFSCTTCGGPAGASDEYPPPPELDDGLDEASLRAVHAWEAVDRVALLPDVTRFKRRARRQQSLWRENEGLPVGSQPLDPKPGGDSRELGSRLPLGFATESGANFLDDALAAVRARLATPQPHQMLDSKRLWADLLSSMPMCFNLFGSAWAHQDRAAAAIATLWPDSSSATSIGEVIFEWSPGRLDGRYLGNRSAFDVAFLPIGEQGPMILGVETKYHEHTRPEKPARDERLDRYLEVAEQSGAFRAGFERAVNGTWLQQIWQDHLLLLSMLQNPDQWAAGRFVVVYPAANPSFAEATSAYSKLLTDDATFGAVTVEELLDAGVLGTESIQRFSDRYVL